MIGKNIFGIAVIAVLAVHSSHSTPPSAWQKAHMVAGLAVDGLYYLPTLVKEIAVGTWQGNPRAKAAAWRIGTPLAGTLLSGYFLRDYPRLQGASLGLGFTVVVAATFSTMFERIMNGVPMYYVQGSEEEDGDRHLCYQL